ncbi:HD domain-containing protein [Sesbania bispinosa]|nr:HD domain-containing protein [Sesbania bispinosa]
MMQNPEHRREERRRKSRTAMQCRTQKNPEGRRSAERRVEPRGAEDGQESHEVEDRKAMKGLGLENRGNKINWDKF